MAYLPIKSSKAYLLITLLLVPASGYSMQTTTNTVVKSSNAIQIAADSFNKEAEKLMQSLAEERDTFAHIDTVREKADFKKPASHCARYLGSTLDFYFYVFSFDPHSGKKWSEATLFEKTRGISAVTAAFIPMFAAAGIGSLVDYVTGEGEQEAIDYQVQENPLLDSSDLSNKSDFLPDVPVENLQVLFLKDENKRLKEQLAIQQQINKEYKQRIDKQNDINKQDSYPIAAKSHI